MNKKEVGENTRQEGLEEEGGRKTQTPKQEYQGVCTGGGFYFILKFTFS